MHAFTPDELGAWARGAGFEDVRVRGEELLANWFGWMNRTLEATALPEDIPWLWRQYAFRGYLALQRVDVALLEGRLPPQVFYNLMVAGTQAGAERCRPHRCRKGLVALGDSITVGEGSMALGVTPLSWAQWLAKALDLPFTSYAVNGATTADVLHEQLPRVRADYDVAALYAGVNDVRSLDFDLAAYERDLDAVAAGLAPRADAPAHAHAARGPRPPDVARPSRPHANAAVRRVAERHGAVVADLADFGGWTNVLPDVVHPTPLGQVEIADRAARALGAPRAAVGARRRPPRPRRALRAGPRARRSRATSCAGRASA